LWTQYEGAKDGKRLARHTPAIHAQNAIPYLHGSIPLRRATFHNRLHNNNPSNVLLEENAYTRLYDCMRLLNTIICVHYNLFWIEQAGWKCS
jgi:hypothetical protein